MSVANLDGEQAVTNQIICETFTFSSAICFPDIRLRIF